MSLMDDLLKLAGIAGSAWTIYSLFRKAPQESRALEVNARKTAAETEALELANDDKKRRQLTEMDESIGKMRVLIGEQVEKYDAQQEEIKQLRRDNNTQADGIQQLQLTVETANASAAEYRTKWETTRTGLDECRASCQQQAAEIRVLRAILIKNGWFSPEIEAVIQAELDVPPETPKAS